MALREAGTDPEGKTFAIIGAGGAARALCFYIAPYAKRLVILNRTVRHALSLASAVRETVDVDIVGRSLTKEALADELRSVDILINSTPVGMQPRIGATLVDPLFIRPEMVVFDIVYNPSETRLLREAKAVGAKVIGGLKMLVYQGILAFEIWTGKCPSSVVMMEAIERVLSR
jgi:shikimate dehydrogenase